MTPEENRMYENAMEDRGFLMQKVQNLEFELSIEKSANTMWQDKVALLITEKQELKRQLDLYTTDRFDSDRVDINSPFD